MKKGYRLIQATAVALILLSLGMLVFRQIQTVRYRDENEALAARIAALLPERTWGSPLEGSGEMPVLEVDGIDYVCLLEVPALGLRLPVANRWQPGDLKRHPARYWGSIYDGTCILGGSGREGQFDFCARLELGDEIIVTDLRGTAFRCQVERIDRMKTVDFEGLANENPALTLFVRERYDTPYIVVRCGWPH